METAFLGIKHDSLCDFVLESSVLDKDSSKLMFGVWLEAQVVLVITMTLLIALLQVALFFPE